MEGLGLFTALIVGGVAGWLASLVMKTNEQQGLVLNIVVGIIGAFVGGLVFNALGFETTGSILNTLVVATIGAVIFLGVLRLFTNRSA